MQQCYQKQHWGVQLGTWQPLSAGKWNSWKVPSAWKVRKSLKINYYKFSKDGNHSICFNISFKKLSNIFDLLRDCQCCSKKLQIFQNGISWRTHCWCCLWRLGLEFCLKHFFPNYLLHFKLLNITKIINMKICGWYKLINIYMWLVWLLYVGGIIWYSN